MGTGRVRSTSLKASEPTTKSKRPIETIFTKPSSQEDWLVKALETIRVPSEGSAYSRMPWQSRIADDGTLKAALRGTKISKPLTQINKVYRIADSVFISGMHSAKLETAAYNKRRSGLGKGHFLAEVLVMSLLN